ncbi:MAG: mechanosensitive ion channel [Endomicrobium sp.]|jgi:small conductance mechanosensitive channel|nr:mechanosensitive ion channel [Endomicrobium sp.]
MDKTTDIAQQTVEASNIAKHTINTTIDKIVENIPNIIFALLIFIIGFYISKLIKKFINKILIKSGINKGLSNFIAYTVFAILVTVVALTSLQILGIQTTSFVAVLGAAGFSIGLAFKEILSNFGSGMIILFFKPFSIGDYIKIADQEGVVSDIQIFSTVLKTVDNKIIVIPNLKLTSDNITNYTNQKTRRIDYSFDVAYDTDIEVVKKILSDIFKEEKRILQEPKPAIGLNKIENNICQVIGKPWVKTEDYWDVYHDVIEKIKIEFDKNDIKVPHKYYLL